MFCSCLFCAIGVTTAFAAETYFIALNWAHEFFIIVGYFNWIGCRLHLVIVLHFVFVLMSIFGIQPRFLQSPVIQTLRAFRRADLQAP